MPSDRNREGGALSRTSVAFGHVGSLSRTAVAEVPGLHVNSVDRIRKRLALEGERPALERQVRQTPARIDGAVEAQPDRRLRRAAARGPRRPDAARCVARREDALDVDAAEHAPEEPSIRMREASKQLRRAAAARLRPRPARESCRDERRGTQSIFPSFDPLAGWRRVGCRDGRTRSGRAEEIRRLLAGGTPHAKRIKRVCGNPNTHDVAGLRHAFPAAEAHAPARRREIHDTPRKGGRLDVAEIESSALARQGPDRRLGSATEPADEAAACERARNAARAAVRRRFATADARVKPRRL